MLLSACLIVRDAERSLQDCLGSMTGLTDEVVIHDTGSSDRTLELVKAFSARLTHGEWVDDFARSRNEALQQCRGQWVLSIDADETVSADAVGLRRWLAEAPDSALAVTVRNDDVDAAVGYEYTTLRLFRRANAHWVGRVHERLVIAGDVGSRPLRLVPPELLRLEHRGYAEEGAQRRRGERNGRIAALELAELTADPTSDPVDVARVVLHIGRAAIGTGDLQRAIDAFEAVRDLQTSGQLWAEATDHMARVLLGSGDAWIALLLTDQLVSAGITEEYCRWLRAQGLAQTGSPREALRELHGLTWIIDTAGRRYDPSPIQQLRELCEQLIR